MNNVEIATSITVSCMMNCNLIAQQRLKASIEYKYLTDTEKEEVDQRAHDQCIAMGFLKQADSRSYGMVLADLEYDYMKGNTNYPLDMSSAYRLLDEFKLDKSGKDSHERSSTHIAFVQGNSEPECYTCGLPGYTKFKCPRCNKQTTKKAFDAKKNPKPKPRPKPSGKKVGKNFAQMHGRKSRKKTEKPAL